MDINTSNSIAPPLAALAERTLQNMAPKAPAADSAAPVAPAAAVAAAEQVDKPAPIEHVAQAVKTINATLKNLNQDVEFTIDDDSHRTVVKVIDQETKQVLRQMPSQEALDIAKALDRLQGLLIKQEA